MSVHLIEFNSFSPHQNIIIGGIYNVGLMHIALFIIVLCWCIIPIDITWLHGNREREE